MMTKTNIKSARGSRHFVVATIAATLLFAATLLDRNVGVYSLEVRDLTRSNGILHYGVDNIKVIDKYYESYHYYETASLGREVSRIVDNVDQYRKSPIFSIISTSVEKLRDEMSILRSDGSLTNSRIEKRGVFNGLGTAISWLTGNMDANDKERYDKIIQQIGVANRQSNVNEMNLINVNRALIDGFNSEVKNINKNFQKVQSGLNDVTSYEKAQNFLAHVSSVRDTVTELLMSMEFCKKQIIHYNVMIDILKNIPKNVTPISNNYRILIDNTRIFCSYYEESFHVFVKLPVHEKNYKGYLVVPIPFKALTTTTNSAVTVVEASKNVDAASSSAAAAGASAVTVYYKQISVSNDLVVEKSGGQLYYGDCFYDDAYYCRNLIKVNEEEDRCLVNIIRHGANVGCRYEEPRSEITFNEYLKIYIIYNTPKLLDCKGESVFLPSVALVNTSSSDCIPALSKIYVHNYNHVFKPTYDDFKLDSIARLNVTVPPFVQVQTVFDEYQMHFLGAVALVILVVVVALSYFCYKKKCCSKRGSTAVANNYAAAPILVESLMPVYEKRKNMLKSPIYTESVPLFDKV